MPTLQITLCEIVNLQELFLRKPLGYQQGDPFG
jgi:hypothetical protein